MTIVNPHSDEVDGPSLSQRQAADDIVRRDAMLAEQMQTPVGRRYVFEEVLGEWRCLRDCKVVRADVPHVFMQVPLTARGSDAPGTVRITLNGPFDVPDAGCGQAKLQTLDPRE